MYLDAILYVLYFQVANRKSWRKLAFKRSAQSSFAVSADFISTQAHTASRSLEFLFNHTEAAQFFI